MQERGLTNRTFVHLQHLLGEAHGFGEETRVAVGNEQTRPNKIINFPTSNRTRLTDIAKSSGATAR